MKPGEKYETVIGLEVHAQLLTRSKLFCSDSTVFGSPPNTQVSVISLGHPGTLPRLNREVIPMAVKLGLALNCDIVKENYFARKNYFYPDLPKGYQISQHTTPICRNGFVDIGSGHKKTRVRINRIHMEEDAGKTIHAEKESLVDYNRADMPLLEIVTEPDIRSAEEAFDFVNFLRKLVRKTGVCDGNMEEGSFRVDVNISVRKKGDPVYGTRVEIKNLNSVRFIRNCILFEEKRLFELVNSGQPVIQQTRGYNEKDGTTYLIRAKEDEDDYRYFPEPDLPPFIIDEALIESLRASLPPNPEKIKISLSENFSLSEKEAAFLAEDDELISFFMELTGFTKNYKSAYNWTAGPVRNFLASQELSLEHFPVKAVLIAELINLVDEGIINYGIASQKVFPALVEQRDLDIRQFIKNNNLVIEQSTGELERLIQQVLDHHPEKITEYKRGKKGLIGLFVGEVMRLSNGKADARMVTEMIQEKLKAY
jgi:aspartyl-tRNA(Asn)/glutamyl-tRNA(Gln) amidotransferase subunit B